MSARTVVIRPAATPSAGVRISILASICPNRGSAERCSTATGAPSYVNRRSPKETACRAVSGPVAMLA